MGRVGYGHLFPERDEEITAGLEAAFAGAANSTSTHDADVIPFG